MKINRIVIKRRPNDYQFHILKKLFEEIERGTKNATKSWGNLPIGDEKLTGADSLTHEDLLFLTNQKIQELSIEDVAMYISAALIAQNESQEIINKLIEQRGDSIASFLVKQDRVSRDFQRGSNVDQDAD